MDKQTIAEIRQWLERYDAIRQLARNEGNALYEYGEFDRLEYEIAVHGEGWLRALLAAHDACEAKAARERDLFGAHG
jgi:hypothetical protein